MTTARNETTSGMAVLVRFNLRRTFTSVYGLLYLIIGIVIPVAVAYPIASSIGNSPGVTGVPLVSSLIPALLPMFATVGSMGVAYLFSSDRSNGLYEYLLATRRIKISDIFISYAVIDSIVVTVVLGLDLPIIYIILALRAPLLLHGFFILLLVYSIPVAYFVSLISVLAMLTWSSLSKRYVGVNSPGGIGSVIGVIPSILFIFLGIGSGLFSNDIDLLGGIFSIVVFAIFIVILVVVVKLMSNERMLA